MPSNSKFLKLAHSRVETSEKKIKSAQKSELESLVGITFTAFSTTTRQFTAIDQVCNVTTAKYLLCKPFHSCIQIFCCSLIAAHRCDTFKSKKRFYFIVRSSTDSLDNQSTKNIEYSSNLLGRVLFKSQNRAR